MVGKHGARNMEMNEAQSRLSRSQLLVGRGNQTTAMIRGDVRINNRVDTVLGLGDAW